MRELIEIQKKLKAPKGQYNSFGKYKYRSLEDILEAVKPLLNQHECYLTLSDEMVMVGDRLYVRADAVLTNSDGNSIRVSAFAREEETKKGMDGAQVTGAASSYARKYALNGLFCIDDTKDADTDEYTARTQEKTQKTEKPTTTENTTETKKRKEKKTLGDIECQSIELSNQIFEWVYKNKYEKTFPKENFSFYVTMQELYNIPSETNLDLLVRGWADFLNLKKMTING